jgi:predicted secreted protein
MSGRAGAFALAVLLAAPATARADTVLHLAETATVQARPDELAATLQVQATAPSAAEAQARINALAADALARVREAVGVTAQTGVYDVFRPAPPGPQEHRPAGDTWQATQSITLHGTDGAAVLALVGALQQKGLAVTQLGWRLSADAERTARQAATRQALQALRGRVDEAAGLLGLKFVEFREVRLDAARPQPFMPRMLAAAASPGAAPPPSAMAEDTPVSATAEADALLRP